jgi:hypothetical protein
VEGEYHGQAHRQQQLYCIETNQCEYQQELVDLRDLAQQVLRQFFPNFGLIFQYVSPLDPWICDPKEKFFCLYRKYDF